MTRRVRPGDQFNITAAEYNQLLAAADVLHKNRLPGGGGPRTHLQNAATARVHNTTTETIPIGGVGGFLAPLNDPLEGLVELARFVRDATINVGKPAAHGSTGRVGVAIEPIAEGKVGRVVRRFEFLGCRLNPRPLAEKGVAQLTTEHVTPQPTNISPQVGYCTTGWTDGRDAID